MESTYDICEMWIDHFEVQLQYICNTPIDMWWHCSILWEILLQISSTLMFVTHVNSFIWVGVCTFQSRLRDKLMLIVTPVTSIGFTCDEIVDTFVIEPHTVLWLFYLIASYERIKRGSFYSAGVLLIKTKCAAFGNSAKCGLISEISELLAATAFLVTHTNNIVIIKILNYCQSSETESQNRQNKGHFATIEIYR